MDRLAHGVCLDFPASTREAVYASQSIYIIVVYHDYNVSILFKSINLLHVVLKYRATGGLSIVGPVSLD